MHPIGFEPMIASRTALDFTGRSSQFAPDASMLVSCIRCGRLHSPTRLLEFNPLCPACAGPLGSVGR